MKLLVVQKEAGIPSGEREGVKEANQVLLGDD